MPIYVYECQGCGERVEALRRIERQDEPLECPECGGECKPCFTTAHWNWGTAAAAHGGFIEETRKGYHGVNWVGGKK